MRKSAPPLFDAPQFRLSNRGRSTIKERDRLSGDLRIENIGVHISSIWPTDRADFLVDSQTSKLFWIKQRSKNTFEPNQTTEVDVAFNPILKPKVNPITL